MDLLYNSNAGGSHSLQLHVNELLLSCQTLDTEASGLIQTVVAKAKTFHQQQLAVVGVRLARERERRQIELRFSTAALRYRQQEAKLHRLQQEVSRLQQVLQQQQQQMAFLRAEDQTLPKRSREPATANLALSS